MPHLVAHLAYEQAVAAYYRDLDPNSIPREPNASLSTLVQSARPTWFLRNVQGEIARVDAISGRVHASFKETPH